MDYITGTVFEELTPNYLDKLKLKIIIFFDSYAETHLNQLVVLSTTPSRTTDIAIISFGNAIRVKCDKLKVSVNELHDQFRHLLYIKTLNF